MGDSALLASMKKLLNEKNWEELKDLADDYADDYSDDIEGFLYAGKANLALNDIDEASYFFSMAKRIDENNIEVSLALGKIGMIQDAMSIARHNFRAVLTIQPDNLAAMLGLGDCAYHESDFMGSLEYYNKGIQLSAFASLDPAEKGMIIYKAAHSYQQNNQFEEGLTFIKANRPANFSEELTLVERDIYKLQANEDNVLICTEALYNNALKAKYIVELAQLLNVKGKKQRVETLYTELLSMDLDEKTKAEAHYSRAGLRFELGNSQGALEDFNQLLSLNQEWYYYTERAECHITLKNAKSALADYKAAIELQDPPLYNTIKGRGDLYMKAKAYDKAIADYTRLTKINNQDPDGYLALAGAFRAQKEMVKAFKMYLEAEIRGSMDASDILVKKFGKQVAQMRTKASSAFLAEFQPEFAKNESSPILQKVFGKLWNPDMNRFILAMGDEAQKFPATALEQILDEISKDMLIITPQGLLFFEGTNTPLEAYYKIEVESQHAILLEIQPAKGGKVSNMRISFHEGSLVFTYPVQAEEVPAKYFVIADEISLEQKERLTTKQYNTNYLEAIEASIAELTAG
jgi:tetratricopeptide (TPR) repeat protein